MTESRYTAVETTEADRLGRFLVAAPGDTTENCNQGGVAETDAAAIWPPEGQPPQQCFARFDSFFARARTEALKRLATADMVFVSVVVSLDFTGVLEHNTLVQAIDLALNAVYIVLAVLIGLRISVIADVALEDKKNGAFTMQQHEIMDPSKIAQHMVMSYRSWFDLLASLLFWTLYLPRPWHLLALIRLLRCHHLWSDMGRLQQLSAGIPDHEVWKVIELFLVIYLFTHLVSCVYYLATPQEADALWQDDDGSMPWQLKYLAVVRQGAFYVMGPKFSPGTGVPKYFLETLLSPVSAVFGAYVLGRITVIINRAGQRWAQHQERVAATTSMMNFLGAPADLKDRVARYFSYLNAHGMDMTFSKLAADLSPGLRTELAMTIFAPLIQSAPFFKGVRVGCIERIILAFEQVVYCPGDTILHKGDVGDCMYFVIQGICTVHATQGGDVLAQKEVGDFFGEVALVYPSMPRTAWIIASGYTVVAKLSKTVLTDALRSYPEEERRMLSHIKKSSNFVQQSDSFNLRLTGDGSLGAVTAVSAVGSDGGLPHSMTSPPASPAMSHVKSGASESNVMLAIMSLQVSVAELEEKQQKSIESLEKAIQALSMKLSKPS
eukprot:gb/GFBE01004531.1/.p1 GENE.gb/GFBE01004531.1/~~gb/GFBE01004531.1/.p1  ORF type:complete len:608 (+),score=132.65 gb/GFBE01004531.1/:1-1824(+)